MSTSTKDDPGEGPFRIYTADSLGAVIRHYRLHAGLTQAELAKQSGLNRSYLSELESGKETEQVKRLLRCCVNSVSASLSIGRTGSGQRTGSVALRGAGRNHGRRPPSAPADLHPRSAVSVPARYATPLLDPPAQANGTLRVWSDRSSTGSFQKVSLDWQWLKTSIYWRATPTD